MLKYISNKIPTCKIINELRTGAIRVMSTGGCVLFSYNIFYVVIIVIPISHVVPEC